MAIELAEFIAQLRSELSVAMEASKESNLRFELGPIEIELALASAKEAQAGAKVRFWVVDASADGKVNASSTQKLKLTLDPTDINSPTTRAMVAGTQEDGEK